MVEKQLKMWSDKGIQSDVCLSTDDSGYWKKGSAEAKALRNTDLKVVATSSPGKRWKGPEIQLRLRRRHTFKKCFRR